MNTDLTRSELALAQFINDNIDLFANGFTDWNKLRAYCIQRCVEQNIKDNLHSPIANACMANNVSSTYYSKYQVFRLAQNIAKSLQN